MGKRRRIRAGDTQMNATQKMLGGNWEEKRRVLKGGGAHTSCGVGVRGMVDYALLLATQPACSNG